MMKTSLFVIANVKQLRTDGSFRVLLSFFRTSWGVGLLNSAIFNSFHNRVEFGTILEGLRNFGGGGGFEPPQTSLGTPLQMNGHCCVHPSVTGRYDWTKRGKTRHRICATSSNARHQLEVRQAAYRSTFVRRLLCTNLL